MSTDEFRQTKNTFKLIQQPFRKTLNAAESGQNN